MNFMLSVMAVVVAFFMGAVFGNHVCNYAHESYLEKGFAVSRADLWTCKKSEPPR